MLSIEQLNEIKERVSREIRVRHPQGRLVVSFGTTGLAAGARQVMAAALDEINSLGLNLAVTGEDSDVAAPELPVVRVLVPEQGETVYSHVSPEKVRQIVRELAVAADSN